MTCQWCYQENEMINLCNITDHSICKLCYETYQKTYPLRIKGCPYCKGLQENPLLYIPDQNIDTIPYEVMATMTCIIIICMGIIIYFLIIILSILYYIL